MRIELRHTDEIPFRINRPCEICERDRPEIGAIAVIKQIALEEPHADFLICDVCAAKIAIAVTKRHMLLDQQRAPPPPVSNGGGGS